MEPDVLDGVEGAEAGGVAGEGDGLLRVGEEDVADLLRGAVAKEFEQTLGVDGLVPGAVLALEVVGTELDEQDAGLGIICEVVIEGEVVGNGEDGVGDGYVAGLEAGIALDDVGVDAGHGGGVAEDQDVAVAILHVEDGVVGLNPDAGAVVQEEVRTAETDEDGDGQKRKQEQDERVTKCRSACFGVR